MGYRLQQRKKKQRTLKKIKSAVTISVIVILVIIFAVSAVNVIFSSKDNNKKITKSREKNSTKKITELIDGEKIPNIFRQPLAILIVVGGNEKIEDSKTQDVLLISKEAKKVALLKIPSDTVISIPGNDFEKVQSVIKYGGIKTLQSAISNFLRIPVKYYLYFKTEENSPQNIGKKVLTANLSNLKSASRVEISNKLSKNKGIKQLILPTRKLDIANESFLQPVNDEIKTIVINYFVGTDKRLSRTVKNKLIIDVLNGNGIAGSASKVALKLLKNGYEIGKIGNAKDNKLKDNFENKVTKIINYSATADEIEIIKKILGKGVVEQSAKPETNSVTIIVGADLF